MTATAPKGEPGNSPVALRRLPALDGLRGLAAISIIATHAGFASGRSLRHDVLAAFLGRFDFGVALFFVMSGLLLYRPYVSRSYSGRPDPAVRTFWRRRLVRIMPALWVMVAVTLAIISQRRASVSDWVHYLLLIQVYDHHEVDANLSQLWTLSAELAFYAVLPLLAAVVRRRSRTQAGILRGHLVVVIGLVTSALVFNVVQSNLLTDRQAPLWAPCYVDWFAIGLLFAVLSATPPQVLAELSGTRRAHRLLTDWAASPLSCWACALTLWILTTTEIATPRTVAVPTFWQWTIQHYLFAAAAAFTFVPLVFGSGGRVGAVLGGRGGRLLGELSYSMYLWHLPLLLLLQRTPGFDTFGGRFWALFALTTLSSAAVAALSWFGLEQPLLRYDERRRRQAGRPTTAASKNAETVSN